jgi:hypothetical protein
MGQRKSSYLDVAKSAQETARGIGGYREELGGFRRQHLEPMRYRMEEMRTAPRPDIETARGAYKKIIESPEARGFSPETVRSMYGAATEAGAGARGSYLRDIGKSLAASGMGHTGAGLRMQKAYDEGFEARNRASMRDIQIENEKMKRGEYMRAVEQMPALQEMENRWNLQNMAQQAGMLGMEAENWQDIGRTYPMELQALSPQMQAYEQAYRPGFWGQLGSSFAQGLGSGAAGFLTGGVQGAGYALGQRAMRGRGGYGPAGPAPELYGYG